MNIREFLLEKPQENNIISFLQDGASQNENQNTNEYLASLKNEAINDFYKNKETKILNFTILVSLYLRKYF